MFGIARAVCLGNDEERGDGRAGKKTRGSHSASGKQQEEGLS
jgi:hypothetical protein